MNGGEGFHATTRKETAMMTNSEFFKAAHAIARETRANFETYRMAFSSALKGLYAMEKTQSKPTTYDFYKNRESRRLYCAYLHVVKENGVALVTIEHKNGMPVPFEIQKGVWNCLSGMGCDRYIPEGDPRFDATLPRLVWGRYCAD